VIDSAHVGVVPVQPVNPFGVERRRAMPLYEYFCDRCGKEVSLTQTISEHAKGAACPECGNREMRPLVGPFFSKTSRKS
jgi:putative FmdB family regulatory protein